MYNKFFGFKEKPFKLVPNPEYLFLSKSHEEALAHLSYAISHGDGFVEIIGEVGTGKTTLCRVFLENLDTSIEAAYIFNPKLDALQLLKAINDEFNIDSKPDNTKDLIDRLNTFLIEKKRAGRKVLVLIDEAQNLSLEVLEQLRLLSNLETTQEKLLQIILVGQPELGELLASHQLRQLGQRITINCRLTPLTFQETRDYIKHRIALASHRAGPPFDNGSLRAIYEYSRGIPRLINIACDRALLNAFSRNSFKITTAITREAVSELVRQKTDVGRRRHQVPAIAALSVIALALIGAALYFYVVKGRSINPAPGNSFSQAAGARIIADNKVKTAETTPDIPVNDAQGLPGESRQMSQEKEAESDPASAPSEPQNLLPAAIESAAAPASIVDQDADPDGAEQFLSFLKSLNSRHSRNAAILQAIKLWHPDATISKPLEKIEYDQVFFRKAAEENGLLVQPLATEANLSMLQTLNLPAVLTFYLPNHAWPKYLTLEKLDPVNIYLDPGDQGEVRTVDRKTLLRYWSGEAFVVWKNFVDLGNIIAEGAAPESIKSLKKLLQQLAYKVDPDNSGYDTATRQAIENIQQEKGLEVDGIVGPFTKIVLYNENNNFVKPSLAETQAVKTENGS